MEIYSPLRAGQQGSAGPGFKRRKARVVLLPSPSERARVLVFIHSAGNRCKTESFEFTNYNRYDV